MKQVVNDLIKSARKTLEIMLAGAMILFLIFNMLLILSAQYESSLYGTNFFEECQYIFTYFYGGDLSD